jgi:uncharacterized membrane protein
MAEVKERTTPKSRVETLSDLIFGLALSIGALSLIGQPLTDFTELVLAIFYYAFSFLILISVWFGYTRLMSSLHVETRNTLYLNVIMLFLVSIEPFLFNQLLNGELSTQSVSVLYALDLAGLFLVQAFLANIILSDKTRTSHILQHYRLLRNSLLIGAATFFVSVIPIFWDLTIPVGNDTFIHLTFLIWLIPLFQRPIRHLWERRVAKRKDGYSG